MRNTYGTNLKGHNVHTIYI